VLVDISEVAAVSNVVQWVILILGLFLTSPP
jgi:hypothetical protein